MKPCTRCSGFLTIENWFNIFQDGKQSQLQRTRCVNCGAIDDPVILANRRQPYRPGSKMSEASQAASAERIIAHTMKLGYARKPSAEIL